MPKVSDAHLEARRRGILAAAQRCVSRKGVHATTMRDICRAANLSPGGVYRYFNGKQEILRALAEQRQAQVRQFFDLWAAASGSRPQTADRLAALVARLDGAAAHDGLRLDAHLWSEALTTDEMRHRLTESHQAVFAALSERLDTLSGVSPTITARLVLALLQGLALQKALEPELDLTNLSRELRRLLIARPGD
jgi:AcrR family transcriptional regulator